MNVDLSLGMRLEEHWRESQAPTLCAPAAPEEVIRFERLHGHTLPSEFRGYLQCVNGFDQAANYQDERGFNFWPLASLSSVSEYEGGKYHFSNDDDYFIFCDYLDFCWAYAISLDPSTSKVVMVGTKDGEPKTVADSFAEFVELYLKDDERLYG